ncbi:MAG: hypothetical protein JWM05_934, partial [Acidimicrobiales bacterium]|nr:hypothetical protein [Acidimicrobiales bacterium]
AQPPRPAGPIASAEARFGARAIDLAIAAVLAALTIALGPHDRPDAIWFLVIMVLTAYETTLVAAFGATPGKLALGLRVAQLDRVGRPAPVAAFRRSLITSTLTALPVVGWAGWVMSSTMSPLRRGVADRAGGTIVVRRGAPQPLATASLPGYADAQDVPRMSPLGRVADLEDRRRARLRRLGDAPLLVLAMTALIGVAALPTSRLGIILISSTLWLVAFLVDETWRISRVGATAGHRQAGLVVRSIDTGEPPTPGRAFARALVLGFTLYVPLLWPLLAVSLIRMKSSPTGRALHDLAGRTVVVADPQLDPEEQRQRTMSLRLGKAI